MTRDLNGKTIRVTQAQAGKQDVIPEPPVLHLLMIGRRQYCELTLVTKTREALQKQRIQEV